ncbi:MAG: FAD-dependent oxidoreductase [Planctomycetaceae bacterium]|nr:FAD-dependent oxidoreductase [Planctomycetaceae bacterium]
MHVPIVVRGCIPSKALLHVAKVIEEAHQLTSGWGVEFGSPRVDINKVRARKEKVIDTLTGGLAQLAKRRNVQVIRARGRFENSTTLILEGSDPSIPEGGKLTFDYCVLATGSIPAMPQNFQIGSERVMDSTGALKLADIPGKLLVIGGGYIGLEMGTVYAHLGSQVSVVEWTDTLLPGADRDLVAPLQRRLKQLFDNRIFLSTKVGSVAEVDNQVEVTFEGPGKFGHERFDRVLVSVGRRPASHGIGLENTHVQVNPKGFVVCDKQQRTADPHIFAIGDIAGEPMLAHKASHEAKVAIEVILGRNVSFDKQAIPAVVFTDPEIAWAGLTEDKARSQDPSGARLWHCRIGSRRVDRRGGACHRDGM